MSIYFIPLQETDDANPALLHCQSSLNICTLLLVSWSQKSIVSPSNIITHTYTYGCQSLYFTYSPSQVSTEKANICQVQTIYSTILGYPLVHFIFRWRLPYSSGLVQQRTHKHANKLIKRVLKIVFTYRSACSTNGRCGNWHKSCCLVDPSKEQELIKQICWQIAFHDQRDLKPNILKDIYLLFLKKKITLDFTSIMLFFP